ncbi:MAG: hypothetical protein A3H28_07110 [Acidobacteria bacterium RIFCSPLOWO2_02_FULL_61_28]|nr:MAG: hypothetical protein A3H28_07110 [Acidobacteria bacterium RIFCSPLOWO2_02_FULL_61_28]
MTQRRLISRLGPALACVLILSLAYAASQQPGNQPQGQGQGQGGQDKKEESKEQPPASQGGGGGAFSSFRRLTDTGRTEQRETTVTAGAKGAKPGVGREVGNAQPSADDRSQVAGMEQTEPTAEEMDAFFKEGQLSPEQKGASQ